MASLFPVHFLFIVVSLAVTTSAVNCTLSTNLNRVFKLYSLTLLTDSDSYQNMLEHSSYAIPQYCGRYEAQ